MNRVLTLLIIFSVFGCGMNNKKEKKQFKESLETAVFTTKFVIEDKKTITYVTHDMDDGAWQFFSEDNFENLENVARIVGLGQIIEMDSTLLEISDMPIGYIASRNGKNDKWVIQKQE